MVGKKSTTCASIPSTSFISSTPSPNYMIATWSFNYDYVRINVWQDGEEIPCKIDKEGNVILEKPLTGGYEISYTYFGEQL